MKMGRNIGFTLLELLVALTLAELLIVLLSLSLRSGLVSWMELRKNNQRVMPQRAVEALLNRQLRVAVLPNTQQVGSPQVFVGSKESLVFTTSHASMGSEAAGVILVVYTQDRAGSDLLYAQRVLTRTSQLTEVLPVELTVESLPAMRAKGWETARISSAGEVRFAFQGPEEAGEGSPERWQEHWQERGGAPLAVAMRWRDTRNGRQSEEPWRIFAVAPFQYSREEVAMPTKAGAFDGLVGEIDGKSNQAGVPVQ